MQQNLQEAQARASATEQQLFGQFDEVSGRHDENMRTWDRGPWETTLHHGQNMADVGEQRHLSPSIEQKTSKNCRTWHKQAGWLDPTKPSKFWTEEEDEE